MDALLQVGDVLDSSSKATSRRIACRFPLGLHVEDAGVPAAMRFTMSQAPSAMALRKSSAPARQRTMRLDSRRRQRVRVMSAALRLGDGGAGERLRFVKRGPGKAVPDTVRTALANPASPQTA